LDVEIRQNRTHSTQFTSKSIPFHEKTRFPFLAETVFVCKLK